MLPQLLIALGSVIVGIALLVWAADRLVAGSAALASHFGVSPLIIGITLVGFGTSAPEMVVSAIASLEGSPGLAIGNALGSNVANIGLILGATALVYPLTIQRSTMVREFPLLLVVMALSVVVMWDFVFQRYEGVVLLLALVVVITLMSLLSLSRPDADPQIARLAENIPTQMALPVAIAWAVVGVVVLPLAAHILVQGAVSIATMFGVSDAVIGLTIVALGTSLPELAAAMASALKREDDLVIGNILGSNIFNLLGVLGISAVIAPMAIAPELITRDLLVMFVITLLLAVFVWRRRGTGRINRISGALLLIFFVAYQGVIIASALGGR
ncbi:MAG: calcium/sodium antiporter [Wenzhouxiangella sp.]|nr:calcium/sodium antiporter [Wenzhouxiangella sp.]MDR9452642.1 calcium/sodium antiporter [Wenzhouxiangella sp.]